MTHIDYTWTDICTSSDGNNL